MWVVRDLPLEATPAEQACEEPPFDISWTRVRFPPPPHIGPPKRRPKLCVEAEGIEPSGWRAGRRSGERAAIVALSAVRSQPGRADGLKPGTRGEDCLHLFALLLSDFSLCEGGECIGEP